MSANPKSAKPKSVKPKTKKVAKKVKTDKKVKVVKAAGGATTLSRPLKNQTVKTVLALNVREKKKVPMKVTKICEHKLTSGRSMFRLAGVTTDAKHLRLSRLIAKADVNIVENATGLKVQKCHTVKSVKKEKKIKQKKDLKKTIVFMKVKFTGLFGMREDFISITRKKKFNH